MVNIPRSVNSDNRERCRSSTIVDLLASMFAHCFISYDNIKDGCIDQQIEWRDLCATTSWLSNRPPYV